MVEIDGGEVMLVCTNAAIEIDVSTYPAIQTALIREAPRALEVSP